MSGLPAYSVVDLNFVKALGQSELNFAVNNLFDAQYSEIVGYYPADSCRPGLSDARPELLARPDVESLICYN